MILNEELFDNLEDIGVSNLLISAINKKWESVQDFNGIISTLQETDYSDIIPEVEELVLLETELISRLQDLLEKVSPEIVSTVTESTAITESFDKDILQWLDNHYATTGWKDNFKKYLTRIEKSGYNTTNLKKDTSVAIKKFAKNHNIKPQKIMSILNEGLRNEENIKRNSKLLKKEIVKEALTEDADTEPSYYVSYYEETPVTDDTGTYVTKCELISSEPFETIEDAREYLKTVAGEDVTEKVTDEFYLDRSKYVSQDRFYIIETEQGSEEYSQE